MVPIINMKFRLFPCHQISSSIWATMPTHWHLMGGSSPTPNVSMLRIICHRLVVTDSSSHPRHPKVDAKRNNNNNEHISSNNDKRKGRKSLSRSRRVALPINSNIQQQHQKQIHHQQRNNQSKQPHKQPQKSRTQDTKKEQPKPRHSQKQHSRTSQSHVPYQPIHLFISCLPGLENILHKEIQHLQHQWQMLELLSPPHKSMEIFSSIQNTQNNQNALNNRNKPNRITTISSSSSSSSEPRIIPGGVTITIPSLTHLYILHLYLGSASHIYWRFNGNHDDDNHNNNFNMSSRSPPSSSNSSSLCTTTSQSPLLSSSLFRARGFPEFKRKLKELIISQNWSSWLDLDSALDSDSDDNNNKKEVTIMPSSWNLKVKVSSSKSKLMHTKAVEERVRDTFEEVFGIKFLDNTSGDGGGGDDGGGGGGTTTKRSGNSCSISDGNKEKPTLQFLIRIERDMVQISLDTSSSAAAAAATAATAKSSNNALHKRGYRLASAKAPLREDLAYALLLSGGLWPRWDLSPLKSLFMRDESTGLGCGETIGDGVEMGALHDSMSQITTRLFDPFCGSGTIAIEGAGILARLPPGRLRSPPLLGTKFCDAQLWEEMKSLALSASFFGKNGINDLQKCRNQQLLFWVAANDRDAGAIAAAKANAERAGVDKFIQFTCGSFSAHPWFQISAQADDSTASSHLAKGSLFIASNPPYGKRIASNKELLVLYQKLGHSIKNTLEYIAPDDDELKTYDEGSINRKTQYAIIGHDPKMIRKTGLPLEVVFSSNHGGLGVVAMTGEVEEDYGNNNF